MHDVVSLAAELMAVPSTTRDEGRVIELVGQRLAAHGWSVTLQEVSAGRHNVWATRKGGGVTLSTHLDTVPPYIAPRLESDRLCGRGACDAKGIAAAMIVAAERLAAAGEERVDLLFVVGEERGSDGARAANQLTPTSRWLINGEPTESRLATGCKGSWRVTARTRGRAAHSAYPELGVSAILPMAELLTQLGRMPLPVDPLLGPSTINAGTITGGAASNIIPAECEVELLVRLVGDHQPVKALLEQWAGDRAELTFHPFVPPQRFHVVPGFDTAPMAYTSDIPLLTRWGTALLFGPGSIHVAHTPDEFIALDELRASVDAYERLVRTLLAS